MDDLSTSDKLNAYKNHCMDEKVCFYNFIIKNLRLLEDNEIYLRYIAYVDDVILYLKNM